MLAIWLLYAKVWADKACALGEIQCEKRKVKMPQTKVNVPKMEVYEYREPDSFVYNYGDLWSDFLRRWGDKNITTDEAIGLLHSVADRLWWADTAPERIGEDSRETCIRFLLHYAKCPVKFDSESQIVEKARQVLIHKVLDSQYVEREASNELVRDILLYFVADIKNRLPKKEPAKRKFEEFLRNVDQRRDVNIKNRVEQLVTALFRAKPNKLGLFVD